MIIKAILLDRQHLLRLTDACLPVCLQCFSDNMTFDVANCLVLEFFTPKWKVIFGQYDNTYDKSLNMKV